VSIEGISFGDKQWQMYDDLERSRNHWRRFALILIWAFVVMALYLIGLANPIHGGAFQ